MQGDIQKIIFTQPGLHYKYTSPRVFEVIPDENGRFSFMPETTRPDIFYISMFGQEYPVYVEPGRRVSVYVNVNRFPLDVQVRGAGQEYNRQYQKYLANLMDIDKHARTERRNFLAGEPNEYLNLLKVRVQLAKEYLAGTPHEIYLRRGIGEYLIARLEFIGMNKNNPGFNAEKARNNVLRAARYVDFFSLESLKAQRAGIRDFADAWSKTFGIQDSLEAKFGRPLMEYDWKRLGFADLNRIKFDLLRYIDDHDALAFAHMYLIAEQLGEGDFATARESWHEYRENYQEFHEYTAFLDTMFQAVSRIQPGEPAPDFRFADENGDAHQLVDFRGQYVLLDFWASWCPPCIEELPYMEELVETYSEHDLKIVSISIDDDRADWESALERFPHNWLQLYAGEGFSLSLLNSYRAGGIPFYVLIDRNGDIVRLNDIRPSFNFTEVFEDILFSEMDHTYVLH